MIEINLLPQQYRSVERTPLPVFIGLLAALVLVGVSIGMFAKVFQETRDLKVRKVEVQEELKRAKDQETEYNELVAKMNDAQKRVDTVFGIAESKIPVSIKFEQLVEIMPRQFWIDRLSFERRTDGTGELKMTVNARGTALKLRTEFEHVLRSSTNFFYHFEGVQVPSVTKKPSDKIYVDPYYLTFDVTLPLRRSEVGATVAKPAPK